MKVIRKTRLQQTSITSFLNSSPERSNVISNRIEKAVPAVKTEKKTRVKNHIPLYEEEEYQCPETSNTSASENSVVTNDFSVKEEEQADNPIKECLDEVTTLDDDQDDTSNDEEEYLPDEDDPNFHCRVCSRTLCSRSSYRYHLVHVHHMTVRPTERDVIKVKIENADFLPDQFDPQNYCAVCDKTMANRSTYREHLQMVHKMTLQNYKKKNARLPSNFFPDPDDPNFYCRVCGDTYAVFSSYRRHLRDVHNMIKPPKRGPGRVNPEVMPDQHDPNNYCRSCDSKFYSRSTFLTHLRKIHKMTPTVLTHRPPPIKRSPPVKKKKRGNFDPNVLPDVNDPNFYCKSCKYTYKNKNQFRVHLKSIHKISVVRVGIYAPIVPDPNIRPDINDPGFHCKSCNRTYANRGGYLSHLRDHHQEIYPRKPPTFDNKSVKPKRNPDIIPDIDDPNFYCKSCNHKFAEKNHYRNHLRRNHKMKLEPIKRHNPIPFGADINDPNNTYCFICKVVCKDRADYDQHTASNHQDENSSTQHVSGNTAVVPEIRDPNNHCKACDLTFRSNVIYWDHLQKSHNIDIDVGEETPTDSKNTLIYCEICQYPYKNQKALDSHLKNKHSDDDMETVEGSIEGGSNKNDNDGDEDQGGNEGEYNYQNRQSKPDDSTIQPNDSNCYCKSCNISFDSTPKYREHLNEYHGYKFSLTNRRPNISSNLKPDANDPNCYCRVCDYKYTNYKYFRKHCRVFHDMKVGVIRKKIVPNFNIIPDPDDKDLFCCSCHTTYGRKSSYRAHIKNVHGIVLAPIRRPHIVNTEVMPDPDDPNYYCKACKISYSGKTNYKQHLLITHTMGLTKKVEDLNIENDLSLPDPNDPDFYCRVCDKRYNYKISYHRHIRSSHKIDLGLMGRMVLNTEIEPDVNDLDGYCRSCDKKFQTRGSYRTHLRVIHRIEPPKKDIVKYPPPHCSYCKIKYSSINYHHRHMLKFHGEQVLPL